MFSKITQHLIDEYKKGELDLPECIHPLISVITGDGPFIGEGQLQKISSKLNSMIERYNEMHPEAWSIKCPSNDDDFGFYYGFGEDKKTVAYLDVLQLQITNILISHKINSYICTTSEKWETIMQ